MGQKTTALFKVASVLFAAFSLIGCGNHYDRIVESDYSFSGRFGSYNSYQFVVDNSFEGTENQRHLIENFIDNKLKKWGYEKKEKKPDLIVLYRFYYDDFEMKGYEQPIFENWITHKFSSKLLAASLIETSPESKPLIGASVHRKENYDLKSYKLREGTVLISFYDRKASKNVWQGYASGVFGDSFLSDKFLENATLKVLNKYRVLSRSSPKKSRWFKHGFHSGNS